MRELAHRRGLAAIAVVFVLGASTARADDLAQIRKAQDLLSKATEWCNHGCYDKTNTILTEVEKELV